MHLAAYYSRRPDPGELGKVAVLVALSGELEQGREIRDEVLARKADWANEHMLKDLHRLEPSEALVWADMIRKQTSDNDDGNRTFFLERYVDALALIGSPEATEQLRAVIASHWASNELLLAEYSMRAFLSVASASDTTWLLGLLQSNTEVERFAFRRAVEVLGHIGSVDVVPFLREQLKNKTIEIATTAFVAIQRIFRREGRIWFGEGTFGRLVG